MMKESFLEKMLRRKMPRKNFLKLGILGIAFSLSEIFGTKEVFGKEKTDSSSARPKKNIQAKYDLVSVSGSDPYSITKQAVQALG